MDRMSTFIANVYVALIEAKMGSTVGYNATPFQNTTDWELKQIRNKLLSVQRQLFMTTIRAIIKSLQTLASGIIVSKVDLFFGEKSN